MNFNFEQNNIDKVEIYQMVDEKNIKDIDNQIKMGMIEFTLHELIPSFD